MKKFCPFFKTLINTPFKVRGYTLSTFKGAISSRDQYSNYLNKFNASPASENVPNVKLKETQPESPMTTYYFPYELSYFRSILTTNLDYLQYQVNGNTVDKVKSYDMMKQMAKYCKTFTKEDLVVFLYHGSIARVLPNNFDPTEMLYTKLAKFLPECTLQELALVSIGMFKTQTKLPDHLVHEVADRLLDVSASTDPLIVGSLLKILKFSTTRSSLRLNFHLRMAIMHSSGNFCAIMNDSRYSHQTILTLMQLYCQLRFISDKLLESFSTYVMNNAISDWRLKDLQRVIFTFGHFGISNGNVSRKVLSALKSGKHQVELEDKFFPSNLLKILLALSYVDTYDEQLSAMLFSPGYLQAISVSETADYDHELQRLYYNIRIDRPDFTDITKPISASDNRFDHLAGSDDDATDLTTREKIVMDVRKLLSEIVGSEYVYVSRLLPQYVTSDVVMCLDEKLQPLSGDRWHSIGPGCIMYPDISPTQYRIAVIIHGPTSYYQYIDKGQRDRGLLGIQATKARLLARLGYMVVQIPFFEVKGANKREVVRRKLRAAIDKFKNRLR